MHPAQVLKSVPARLAAALVIAASLPAAAQVAGDPSYVINQHGALASVDTLPYSFDNTTFFSDGEWTNTNSADGTTRLGSSGYFYDAYSFVVSGSTPVAFSADITSLIGIENVQARLYSGFDPLTELADLVVGWSTELDAPTTGSILGSNTVGAGTYTIEVRGYLTNGRNAVDSGSYAVTIGVSPVPEPTSAAMALGGLLMLAGLSRARRR